MKKSTNLIASALTAAALTFGVKASAQTTTNPGDVWRLGVGVEAGIPTGNLSNRSNFELGATARLQYDTQSNISFMLTSGYYNAFGKNVPVANTTVEFPSLGIIPVKAGLKVFASKNLYFSGEAGAGFEVSGTGGNNNTKLILSPGIGYANYKGLDIGLRYENFSGQDNNYGLVGLRVAYGFKL
jgi:hypothetical protein